MIPVKITFGVQDVLPDLDILSDLGYKQIDSEDYANCSYGGSSEEDRSAKSCKDCIFQNYSCKEKAQKQIQELRKAQSVLFFHYEYKGKVSEEPMFIAYK